VESGGRLGVMIGKERATQAKSLLRAWQWQEPIAVPQSLERVLLVGTG